MSFKYNCKICNKLYKTYQSFWNHNKKFHSNTKKYKCKFCNKEYIIQQSHSKHEKKCEIKENEINKLKINTTNITNNITNNTTNTTNNIINNNFIINAFTKEKIINFPVKELKKFIRNDNYLYNIIEYINFNKKYPENHTFCSTSLEGKYISLLNPQTNMIEKLVKIDF
jgi:hypothetical protein